jgi:hypothetical protein
MCNTGRRLGNWHCNTQHWSANISSNGVPRVILAWFGILRQRCEDWRRDARRGFANVMCGIPKITDVLWNLLTASVYQRRVIWHPDLIFGCLESCVVFSTIGLATPGIVLPESFHMASQGSSLYSESCEVVGIMSFWHSSSVCNSHVECHRRRISTVGYMEFFQTAPGLASWRSTSVSHCRIWWRKLVCVMLC